MTTTLRQTLRRPITDFDWPTIAWNLSRATAIRTYQFMRPMFRVALKAAKGAVILPLIAVLAFGVLLVYVVVEMLHYAKTGELLIVRAAIAMGDG